MTSAFSRASRPGPGGSPTAERQPPLGRVREGPELSMVSATGSQGGRRSSPCPRIRALQEKGLMSRVMGRSRKHTAGKGEASTWAGKCLLSQERPGPGVGGQGLQCQLAVSLHLPRGWSPPGPRTHPPHSGDRRPSHSAGTHRPCGSDGPHGSRGGTPGRCPGQGNNTVRRWEPLLRRGSLLVCPVVTHRRTEVATARAAVVFDHAGAVGLTEHHQGHTA